MNRLEYMNASSFTLSTSTSTVSSILLQYSRKQDYVSAAVASLTFLKKASIVCLSSSKFETSDNNVLLDVFEYPHLCVHKLSVRFVLQTPKNLEQTCLRVRLEHFVTVCQNYSGS